MLTTNDWIAEVQLLALFNLETKQEGVKVHHNAEPEMIAAAQRLNEKGLSTQADGGYLTDLGIEAAEHAQRLLTVLLAV
jgi:uncharacterized protein (TIGR02647 family)